MLNVPFVIVEKYFHTSTTDISYFINLRPYTVELCLYEQQGDYKILRVTRDTVMLIKILKTHTQLK